MRMNTNHGKRWTKEHSDIALDMYKDCYSNWSISRKLGRTSGAVNIYLNRLLKYKRDVEGVEVYIDLSKIIYGVAPEETPLASSLRKEKPLDRERPRG